MSDFLEDKKREIRERLEELREAVQEAERLESALAALEGVSNGGGSRGGSSRSPRSRGGGGGGGGGTGKRGRPKGSGPRAKQALETVRKKPGITIPELAEALEMQQNYLYRVMPDLQKQGLVRKEGRGWHPMEAA
ncbi:hypothetical protein [Conexibacter sp. SYSU D00693]|uniref:hypothetical protein n=1 Tax=Conexibacter sp. SYSU D00693 TaxID=2812560 RepID=UPI00196A3091|nr:hypothetical protein [Conexibacter sp. SYSU D00693]